METVRLCYSINNKLASLYLSFIVPTDFLGVGMLNSSENDTVTGLFDPTIDLVSFPPDKNPVDYYMTVERSTRADIILHNPSVVSYISFLEGNLTKHFLPMRITNFETNVRNIVSISETCLQNTPTKSFKKYLLSNCLHFAVGPYHDLFPGEKVGDFLFHPDNLANNLLPPSWWSWIESKEIVYGGDSLNSSTNKRISDSRRTDHGQWRDRILGFYHTMAGDWGILMDYTNLVEIMYLDKR